MAIYPIIAQSILSADFTKLGQELDAMEKAGTDSIHIDVMDGHFIPNITYGPIIVEACRQATSLALEVHLMIEKPDIMIPEFAKAGADLLSVHAEACTHLNRTIQLIQSLKNDKGVHIKPGVALNPATPLSAIEWVIEEVDFVLIMSVNPGFGGHKFINASIEKIKALSAMIKDSGSKAIIQVEGGLDIETIKKAFNSGAKSFVVKRDVQLIPA